MSVSYGLVLDLLHWRLLMMRCVRGREGWLRIDLGLRLSLEVVQCLCLVLHTTMVCLDLGICRNRSKWLWLLGSVMAHMALVGSCLHMSALNASKLLLDRILVTLWWWLNNALPSILRRVGIGKGSGSGMTIAEFTLLSELRIDLLVCQRLVHVALVAVNARLARSSVQIWVDVVEGGIEGCLAVLMILLFYS